MDSHILEHESSRNMKYLYVATIDLNSTMYLQDVVQLCGNFHEPK